MSFHRVVIALAGLLSFAAPAFAQGSAACKPVTDAMTKVTTAPHHSVTTNSMTGPIEELVAGGEAYLKTDGTWQQGPINPKDALAEQQKNLASNKAYTCQLLRTEAVGGVSTNVYKVHAETASGTVTDGTLWVAPSLGLPLKSDQDIVITGGTKMHMSIAWDYANIKAPIVKWRRSRRLQGADRSGERVGALSFLPNHFRSPANR